MAMKGTDCSAGAQNVYNLSTQTVKKVNELTARGYNWIFPVHEDKTPDVKKWNTVQVPLTNEKLLKARSFGVVCNEENDLLVVDLDRCKGNDSVDNDGVLWYHKTFPAGINTFRVKTPSGGMHLYFKFSPNFKTVARALVPYPSVKVDVRSEKGYVVSFNSIGYSIENDVSKIEIPQELATMLKQTSVQNSVAKIDKSIAVQQKHQTVYKPIGDTEPTELAEITVSKKSELSQMANKLLRTSYTWDASHQSISSLKLVPDTMNCLVVDHVHTNPFNCCLFINISNIVVHCSSHGDKQHSDCEIAQKLLSLCNKIKQTKPKNLTPQEILWTEVRSYAGQFRLQKLNGFVWRPRDNHPFWYESWMSYKEFLNKLFETSREFHQHSRRFKEMMSYLENYDTSDFPDVRSSKRYVAFRNGVFDLETTKFYDLDETEDNIPYNTVCRHFFDFEFEQSRSESNLETPFFDKIVKHQLHSPEVYTMLLAMIGRLQYEVGEMDAWGVMPFILGSAQLGKSTIFNIILKMFGRASTGVISSTQEQVFGLMGLYNKEVIVAPDIPHKMNTVLDCAVFQSMVTGDDVSVASKHLEATSVKWHTPMIWGGNLIPTYTDVGGGAIRRFCLFKFETDIEKVDGSLESKIIKTELGNLFVKCVLAYRDLARRHGSDKFFDFAGEYFRESANDVLNAMNPLAAWLDTGFEENRTGSGVSTYPTYIEGNVEPVLNVKKEFEAYMRYKCPGVKYSWPLLVSAFKAKGYYTKSVNLCKSCKKLALSGCCDFYSQKNRCRSVVNLKLETSDML